MKSPTGITLEKAQEMYQKYIDAEVLIISNQRYKIEDRELERAPLKEVLAAKLYWEKQCYKLSQGRGSNVVSINPINL